jgi:hypothetical protein
MVHGGSPHVVHAILCITVELRTMSSITGAMEGDAICLMLWHNGTMMPKRTSKKSKPTDISQHARAIVEEATGESLTEPSPPSDPPKDPSRKKNPAAVALGKLGG